MPVGPVIVKLFARKIPWGKAFQEEEGQVEDGRTTSTSMRRPHECVEVKQSVQRGSPSRDMPHGDQWQVVQREMTINCQ